MTSYGSLNPVAEDLPSNASRRAIFLQRWVVLIAPMLVLTFAFRLLSCRILLKKKDSYNGNLVAASPQAFHVVPTKEDDQTHLLVQPEDYIYLRNFWDSSPVVVESHKLIFFTVPKVGCTIFKMLFRRMMGYADWQEEDWRTMLPHHPELNGLTYLYDYDRRRASELMTSREYTRAMFVRDPKERLLSAFLDKGQRNNGEYVRAKCCYLKGACMRGAHTLSGFLSLIETCSDEHWKPQSQRMDDKFFPYLDFVGNLDIAEADAKRLLEKIGAWEEFGRSGWGPFGNLSIFEGTKGEGPHDTNAKSQMWDYYTPELEERAVEFYKQDYNNKWLNLTNILVG